MKDAFLKTLVSSLLFLSSCDSKPRTYSPNLEWVEGFRIPLQFTRVESKVTTVSNDSNSIDLIFFSKGTSNSSVYREVTGAEIIVSGKRFIFPENIVEIYQISGISSEIVRTDDSIKFIVSRGDGEKSADCLFVILLETMNIIRNDWSQSSSEPIRSMSATLRAGPID